MSELFVHDFDDWNSGHYRNNGTAWLIDFVDMQDTEHFGYKQEWQV